MAPNQQLPQAFDTSFRTVNFRLPSSAFVFSVHLPSAVFRSVPLQSSAPVPVLQQTSFSDRLPASFIHHSNQLYPQNFSHYGAITLLTDCSRRVIINLRIQPSQFPLLFHYLTIPNYNVSSLDTI